MDIEQAIVIHSREDYLAGPSWFCGANTSHKKDNPDGVRCNARGKDNSDYAKHIAEVVGGSQKE